MRNQIKTTRTQSETKGMETLNWADVCGKYSLDPLAAQSSATIDRLVLAGLLQRKKRSAEKNIFGHESGSQGSDLDEHW